MTTLRSAEEAQLARALVERGVVTAPVLQSALARRAPQDPRSLQEFLSALGLLPASAPPTLQPGAEAATRVDADQVASAPRPASGSARYVKADSGQTLLLPNHEVVVEGLLGQGGMGVVYRVRDRGLGRVAALKLIRGRHDPRRSRRFQREVLVTARLDHPNIPPVYEAGRTASGEDYMLMRLVDGRELSLVIDEAQEDPGLQRELLGSLIKAGEAVAYAHNRGVVHRDLKPQNIMVGAFGEVLVMDWGLARLLRESADEDASLRSELSPAEGNDGLTQEGAFLGTLGFMPPEQARGEDVDGRSDVFALGAILCLALTGEMPVAGESPLELLQHTSCGEVDLPDELWVDVPGELRAIAERALAADRDERYPNVEDLVADLQAYLEGRPVSVYRYRPSEQALRLVRRHPAVFSGIAVAFVLSLVAVWVGARAEEAARRKAAARAEEEALAAWEQLQEKPHPELSERIGQALAALQAAQRRRTLAPHDPRAAEALFEAAFALGEVANNGEQWALSRQAFSQAVGLEVDDERAEEALAQVDRLESAEATRRREAIQEVLARARRGELRERSDGFLDAAFLIGRYPEPQTVGLLAEALEEVSTKLREVERETYLSAAQPTEDERAIGEETVIEGLAEALRLRAAGKATSADEMLLASAGERLERRAQRGLTKSQRMAGARLTAQIVLARRQAEVLPAGSFDLARLACDCLGRLGLRERAISALGQYLGAERDPVRAARAGLALCRLGGEEAEQLALGALRRFGEESAYGEQLKRVLKAQGKAPPSTALVVKEDDAEAHLERAEALRIRGQLKEAIEEYDTALELESLSPDGWVGRARCKAGLGDHAAALSDYDRAIACDASNAEPWAHRSTSQLRLGNIAKSKQDSDKAIELNPEQVDAWLTRAMLHAQSKQWPKARECLGTVIDLAPKLPIAWLERALMWCNEGNLERAREDVEQALELDPKSARGIVLRANLRPAQKLGDTQAVRAEYARALELDPRSADATSGLALLAMSANDLVEARALAEKALKLDPDNPEALGLKALLLVTEQKQEEAQIIWKQAKARPVWISPPTRDELEKLFDALSGKKVSATVNGKAPTTVEELYLQASLAFNTKQWDIATKALDSLLKLDPNHAQALFLRARAREQTGNNKGSLADLVRTVELEPWRAIYRFELGMQRYRMKAYKDAVQDFTRALDLDPQDASCWARRGECRFLLKDHAAAVKDFAEAIRRNPEHPWAWRQRANADYALKRYEDVVVDVTHALKNDYKTARWQVFLRGMAKGRLGDAQGAVEDLQDYLRQFPKGPRSKDCHKFIAKWGPKKPN